MSNWIIIWKLKSFERNAILQKTFWIANLSVEEEPVVRKYDKLDDRRKIQLKVTKKGMDLIEKLLIEMFLSITALLEDQEETMKLLTENLKVFNEIILSQVESKKKK